MITKKEMCPMNSIILLRTLLLMPL